MRLGMQETIWMVHVLEYICVLYPYLINFLWNLRDCYFIAYIGHVGEDDEADGSGGPRQRYPWEGSDRDYEYEEVYSLFHKVLFHQIQLFLCWVALHSYWFI